MYKADMTAAVPVTGQNQLYGANLKVATIMIGSETNAALSSNRNFFILAFRFSKNKLPRFSKNINQTQANFRRPAKIRTFQRCREIKRFTYSDRAAETIGFLKKTDSGYFFSPAVFKNNFQVIAFAAELPHRRRRNISQ